MHMQWYQLKRSVSVLPCSIYYWVANAIETSIGMTLVAIVAFPFVGVLDRFTLPPEERLSNSYWVVSAAVLWPSILVSLLAIGIFIDRRDARTRRKVCVATA